MSQKTRLETALSLLMEKQPLAGGTFIPIERFEEIFEFKRDTQEFNWLIAGIRTALHEKGLHLSGEGLSQTGGYEILPPTENYWVAKLAMARAERNLLDKETLLINTDLEGFTPLQLAKHENTQRILSLRLSALRQTRAHNEKVAKRRKEIIEQSDETE